MVVDMGSILLVEDEAVIAESLLYALRSEGLVATWVRDGALASAALARGGIDLVVLDVGLPDVSGFELCRTWRRSSAVPILFLTARSAEIDRVVGLELGADDYVVKPFSPREVTARIRAILRRCAAPVSAESGRTPFRVDDDRLAITYRGQALALSRVQFRLLRALVQRPGRIFSRSQLIDEASGGDPSLDRTVDSHIKDLRAKLRAVDPAVDAILTRRGEGYALREDW